MTSFRLLVVLLLLAVSPVGTFEAFAADSAPLAAMVENQGLGNLLMNLPRPPLNCVPDARGDFPGSVVRPIGSPPAVINDVEELCAGTNGQTISIRVRFSPTTEIERVRGTIYFDVDRSLESGFMVNFSHSGGGVRQVERHINGGIDYYAQLEGEARLFNIYSHRKGWVGSFPTSYGNQQLELTIPANLVGAFARGRLNVAAAFGDWDVADLVPEPEQGMVEIMNPLALELTPKSSTLLATPDRDPKVRIAAIVEESAQLLVTGQIHWEVMRWEVDGTDITPIITAPANLIKGKLAPSKERPHGGRTFAFDYPINSMGVGRHRLSVLMMTSRAIAGDNVEYDVVQHTER